ncbi:MAG: four helix bundle protein [Candidatus Magasanikbacteria bacterium]
MNEGGEHTFDLEERTFEFAKRTLNMTKQLPRSDTNLYYSNQVIRSSSSMGANYREANDCLGDKDFLFRLRIVRKEAKESIYWLRLIIENNSQLKVRMQPLLQESIELNKIFSSIIKKKEKIKEKSGKDRNN